MTGKLRLISALVVLVFIVTACGSTAVPPYEVEAERDRIIAEAEAEATRIIAEAEAEADTPSVVEELAQDAVDVAETTGRDAIAAQTLDNIIVTIETTASADVAEATEDPTPEVTAVVTEEAVAEATEDPTPEATAVVTEEAVAEATEDPTPEATAVVTEEAPAEEVVEEVAEETDVDDETAEEVVEETAEEIVEEAPADDDFVTVAPEDDPVFLFVRLADVEQGEALFYESACSSCHYVDSTEMLVGPGQLNIIDRAGDRVSGEGPYTYLYNSIRHSQDYIVEGYPPNVMPNYSEDALTDEEVYHLVAYLASLTDDTADE
jgi:hypothetical protein